MSYPQALCVLILVLKCVTLWISINNALKNILYSTHLVGEMTKEGG
jgi:hypothetical protein